RFLDGAALDLGGAARHAYQHARAGLEQLVAVDLADEGLQHFFRHGEIRDDTVLERPDGLDVAGGAAEHALGFGAYRRDRLRVVRIAPAADGDDRRLVEDDALAPNVDESICGPQVDG